MDLGYFNRPDSIPKIFLLASRRPHMNKNKKVNCFLPFVTPAQVLSNAEALDALETLCWVHQFFEHVFMKLKSGAFFAELMSCAQRAALSDLSSISKEFQKVLWRADDE